MRKELVKRVVVAFLFLTAGTVWGFESFGDKTREPEPGIYDSDGRAEVWGEEETAYFFPFQLEIPDIPHEVPYPGGGETGPVYFTFYRDDDGSIGNEKKEVHVGHFQGRDIALWDLFREYTKIFYDLDDDAYYLIGAEMIDGTFSTYRFNLYRLEE